MRDHIQEILRQAGMDENDPNFIATPERYEKTLKELLCGYSQPMPELRKFPCKSPGELVFFGPLKANSLCPHHVLPYMLEGYFAYIPNTHVVGVSKPGRLLQWVAARFILQEEICHKFIEAFDKELEPYGSMMLLKGYHLCSVIRGVKQSESMTTTYASSGLLGQHATGGEREEFWRLVDFHNGGKK